MEKNQFQYDVFIAYSSLERVWVRSTLLPRLEQAGLTIFIDYIHFHRTAPIASEIERAIKQSRKTLLVLTPSFQGSEWLNIEAFVRRSDHIINREQRIVTLIREPYSLPRSVRHYTSVDFTFTTPLQRQIAWTQLLTALGEPPIQEPPPPPQRDTWHLVHSSALLADFTGRKIERDIFTSWLNTDHDNPLLIVEAPSGTGKSTLMWQWLMADVYPAHWNRVVWWDCRTLLATFEYFMDTTLTYLREVSSPSALRQQVDELLTLLREPTGNILLILDGFEQLLIQDTPPTPPQESPTDTPLPTPVATEHMSVVSPLPPESRLCSNAAADYFLHALLHGERVHNKVIIITSRRPRSVEAPDNTLLPGVALYELHAFTPDEATHFLRLQGIRGNEERLATLSATYEHQPLLLRLVAGIIKTHPQQPGDIAIAPTHSRSIAPSRHLNELLQQLQRTLSDDHRVLLNYVAAMQRAVDYVTLKALLTTHDESNRWDEHPAAPAQRRGRPSGSFLGTLRDTLRDAMGTLRYGNGSNEQTRHPVLFDTIVGELLYRGVLLHDKATRTYLLHPQVRKRLYDMIPQTERLNIHHTISTCMALNTPPAPHNEILSALYPLLERYMHLVRASHYDAAYELYTTHIYHPLVEQCYAHELHIVLLQALFTEGLQQLPAVSGDYERRESMMRLAASYCASGQPSHAITLYEQLNGMLELQGDTRTLVSSLRHLAHHQMNTGTLQRAEMTLRRSLEMSRAIHSETDIAHAHQLLGTLAIIRGAWDEADNHIATAAAVFVTQDDDEAQAGMWVQRALLCYRTHENPLDYAQRAQTLLASVALSKRLPTAIEEQWLIATDWMLGAGHRMQKQYDKSQTHLFDALIRCRRNGAIEYEPSLLLELARLWCQQAQYVNAQRAIDDALMIATRSGFVLLEAEAYVVQAEMLYQQHHYPTMHSFALRARTVARCDGPPNYTAKNIYDEAIRLLAIK